VTAVPMCGRCSLARRARDSRPVGGPATHAGAVALKTAKALGLTIPPTVLLRADHVIE
jgi:hypothetical protein